MTLGDLTWSRQGPSAARSWRPMVSSTGRRGPELPRFAGRDRTAPEKRNAAGSLCISPIFTGDAPC